MEFAVSRSGTMNYLIGYVAALALGLANSRSYDAFVCELPAGAMEGCWRVDTSFHSGRLP
jgi:hypothetical protein